LDVSWGEEGRVFVGHIIKDACYLCTLIKQTHLIYKKKKKKKVPVVRHASAPLFPPPYISRHHVVLRTISSPILFVLTVGPRVPTPIYRHGLPPGWPLDKPYSSPSFSPPYCRKSRLSSLDFPPDSRQPRASCRMFPPHYAGEHLHSLYRRIDAPPSTLHLASITRPHSNGSRESLD